LEQSDFIYEAYGEDVIIKQLFRSQIIYWTYTVRTR